MPPALVRRRIAFATLALAVVLAALALHVVDVRMPRMTSEPLVIGGVVLALWALVAERQRTAAKARLDADCARLADAVQRFGVRIEAWIVAGPADELEAEALRRALIDRHIALVASARAHLAGREPNEDAVVQAMTREKERKGRHGPALLSHLAGLQREALTEAQRRGFIGEARLLLLDEALFTLAAVAPLAPAPLTWAERARAAALAVFAPLFVLTTSARLTHVAGAAFVAGLLIVFEALASAPLTAEDDARGAMLAAWSSG